MTMLFNEKIESLTFARSRLRFSALLQCNCYQIAYQVVSVSLVAKIFRSPSLICTKFCLQTKMPTTFSTQLSLKIKQRKTLHQLLRI